MTQIENPRSVADFARMTREAQGESQPVRTDSVIVVRSADYVTLHMPRALVWPLGLLLLFGAVALYLACAAVCGPLCDRIADWWVRRQYRRKHREPIAFANRSGT